MHSLKVIQNVQNEIFLTLYKWYFCPFVVTVFFCNSCRFVSISSSLHNTNTEFRRCAHNTTLVVKSFFTNIFCFISFSSCFQKTPYRETSAQLLYDSHSFCSSTQTHTRFYSLINTIYNKILCEATQLSCCHCVFYSEGPSDTICVQFLWRPAEALFPLCVLACTRASRGVQDVTWRGVDFTPDSNRCIFLTRHGDRHHAVLGLGLSALLARDDRARGETAARVQQQTAVVRQTRA